jgi:hypothetical protein
MAPCFPPCFFSTPPLFQGFGTPVFPAEKGAEPRPHFTTGFARPVRIPRSDGSSVPCPLAKLVFSSANEFGRFLNRVQQKEMTVSQAVIRSLTRGAAAALAAAAAEAAAGNLREGETGRLIRQTAATIAASYILSGVLRAASSE